MSRPLRIAYSGAWYHVMNRGLARNPIFFDDSHCEIFLELLFEIHDRYQVEIHAYCLMGNHYHLLLCTPLGNISKVMRHLDGVYTQRVNRLIGRDGPLFRGRYKAILVEANEYLLHLSRYIHLNPVKAKLVNKAEEYEWSSCRFYLYGKAAHWLRIEKTLSYFDSKDGYRVFLEEEIDKEIDGYISNLGRFPVLGTENFLETVVKKQLQMRHKIREIPEHKLLEKTAPKEIFEIMLVVSRFYGVEMSELKLSKRKSGNLPRVLAMYLSRTIGQYNYQEIAEAFTNISAAGVSRSCQRIRRIVHLDGRLKDEVKKMENQLSFVAT